MLEVAEVAFFLARSWRCRAFLLSVDATVAISMAFMFVVAAVAHGMPRRRTMPQLLRFFELRFPSKPFKPKRGALCIPKFLLNLRI